MSSLPASLQQEFEVAMSERGFASAAWLFVRKVAAYGGVPLVHELRDVYGRAFPVLDAVAAAWLAGQCGPTVQVGPIMAACRGIKRLLVVGLETDYLDILLPQLVGIEVGILRFGLLELDWERVQAHYDGRASIIDMVTFQDFAGPQGAILTFLYGHGEQVTHVRPSWLRLIAADVLAQFHTLVGWDVLCRPLAVDAFWLVETTTRDFSEIV